MDIFEKKRDLWARSKEEHVEFAYENEHLKNLLTDNSFEFIREVGDTPFGGSGRVFMILRRL